MVANLNFAIKAVNEAGNTLREVQSQLNDTEGSSNRLGGAFDNLGGKLSGIAKVAGTVSIATAGMIAEQSIGAASQLGDAVNSLAIATGLSDAKSSEWIGTGEHFGLSAEYLTKSIDKYSKAIEGGIDPETGLMVAAGKTKDMLDAYGITTTDASGKTLDMNTILMNTADVFKGLPDGPEKTAMALKLFGKAGVDMIPMLDQGSAGVAGLMQSVDDMGLTLDESGVAKTKAFAFAQRDMSESIKGVEIQIGMVLMPVMTSAFSWLSSTGIPVAKSFAKDAIGYIHDKFEEWRPTLEAVGNFLQVQFGAALIQGKQLIKGIGDAMAPVIQFFKDHKEATAALVLVLGLLLVALFPVPAAIIAIIAAGTLLLANWDTIHAKIDDQIAKFKELKDKLLELPLIGPILTAFFTGLVLMVTAQFETIKAVFQTAIDFISGIIQLGIDLWHGDFGQFWTDLKALIGSMFEDIKGLFSIQLDLTEGLISTALTGWIGVISDAAPLMLAAGTALLTALYNGVVSGSQALLTFFINLPGRMLGEMSGILTDAYNFGYDLISKIGEGALSAAKKVVDTIGGIINSLNPLHSPPGAHELPGQYRDWAKGVMENLAMGLGDGSLTVSEASARVVKILSTVVDDPKLYAYIKQQGTNIIQGYADSIKAGTSPLIAHWDWFTNQIKNGLDSLLGDVKASATDTGGAWTTFANTWADAWDNISAEVTKTVPAMGDRLTWFKNQTNDAISGLIADMAVGGPTAIAHLQWFENQFKDAIAGLVDSATDPNVAAAFQAFGDQIIKQLEDAAKQAGPATTTITTAVTTAIVAGTPVAVTATTAWGKSIFEGMAKGLADGSLSVSTAFRRITDLLSAAAGDPALLATIRTEGMAIIGAYGNGITTAAPAVTAAVTTIGTKLNDGLTAIGPMVYDAGGKIATAYSNGITSGVPAVTAAVTTIGVKLNDGLIAIGPMVYKAGADTINAYNAGMAGVRVNPIPAPGTSVGGGGPQVTGNVSGQPDTGGLPPDSHWEQGPDGEWVAIPNTLAWINARAYAAYVPGQNRSYDSGGWLPTGVSVAVNNTGRPERVGGSDGITVVINYSAPNALVVDGAAVTQAVKTVLPEIKRQLTMQGSWGMA